MKLVNSVRSNVKGHSPAYLAASGCVGVVVTTVLAVRAGVQLGREMERNPKHDDPWETVKSRWRLLVPPAVSGLATVGVVVGGHRLGARRTLAAQVLLTASERAYTAYREEVREEVGDSKHAAIEARAAERLVAEKPPAQNVIVGDGQVMCCEAHTMRYFSTTMEKIKRAVNEFNSKLIRDDYCTLDEFYWLLGLENTQTSSEVGWRSDKLMELEYTSMLHDEKPVLVFGYRNLRQL